MASLSQQGQAQPGQRMPQLSIFVCGKTGIGKSSLINCILGEDVCKVGDPGASVGATFDAQTVNVKGYTAVMHGVRVTIYDSPGLQDGTDNDEAYLVDMYTKCRDVHLVFYCHDMSVARWTDHEVNAIQLFTKKFGATFWDKAILVLTKANMLQSANLTAENDKREHFLNWTANDAKRFGTEVWNQLQLAGHEAGEIQKCVESIPVVPTGSAAVKELPNQKCFIRDLWVKCSLRVTDPNIRELIISATTEEPTDDVNPTDDTECHPPMITLGFRPLLQHKTQLSSHMHTEQPSKLDADTAKSSWNHEPLKKAILIPAGPSIRDRISCLNCDGGSKQVYKLTRTPRIAVLPMTTIRRVEAKPSEDRELYKAKLPAATNLPSIKDRISCLNLGDGGKQVKRRPRNMTLGDQQSTHVNETASSVNKTSKCSTCTLQHQQALAETIKPPLVAKQPLIQAATLPEAKQDNTLNHPRQNL